MRGKNKNKYFTWVDDKNYEWINQWNWTRTRKMGNTFYAMRNVYENGKRRTLLMHRVILNAPDGMDTDHRDGNGLNNLEKNLRLCTTSENCRNSYKQNRKTYSRYKGVTWRKDRKSRKWQVQIRITKDGKKIKYNLGNFGSERKAAKAYDAKAKELFGEYAKLNF